jgi:hypothetical protein
MFEVWKDISEKYAVSSLGRVKSKYCGRNNILKTSISNTGYEIVRLGRLGGYQSVHRLVVDTFLGKKYEVVNHKDKDKTNNMLYNLEPCTQSHNRKHDFKNKKRFVSFNSNYNKFKVTIRHNKKQQFFGYFEMEDMAYDVAYYKYFELYGEYPWSKL